MLVFSSNVHALLEIEKNLSSMFQTPAASVSDILQYIETVANGDFGCMIDHVLQLGRIYSLDFTSRCTDDEFNMLIDSVCRYGRRFAPFWRWQVYSVKSKKFDKFRYEFHDKLEKISEVCSARHPYCHAVFDMSKYDACLSSDMLVRQKDFRFHDNIPFLENINTSIFADRLIQPDFINRIDIGSCFSIAKNICRCASIERIAVFLRSLFARPDMTCIEKTFCINMLREYFGESTRWRKRPMNHGIRHMSDEPDSSSFSEFVLNVNISGFDCDDPFGMILDAILYRRQWFDEWYRTCSEEIDSVLNCSNFAA